MASPFSRTLRSLEADGLGGWGWKVLAVLTVLGVWCGWFFLTRVAVYAVADAARLEVAREVHPVEAPVAGQVREVRVTLAQEVEGGEILFEVEAREQESRLQEESERLAGLSAQLAALAREVEAERRALAEAGRAAEAELEEARLRWREAAAAARQARDELARLESLHESGLVAEMDLARARTEADQRQAAAEALDQARSRLEFARRRDESDRRRRLEELERERADLAGQETAARTSLARLEQEVERRRIRAPVAGRIGELAAVRVGSFVQAGDRLAAVVPAGEVRAVAEFPPAVALGRVARGQPARLRLTGFPSLQYGSVAATVDRVAGEVRDGRVRVEFEVHPSQGSSIPLQHGLPATVEVEVERVSPAVLVLRAAGKLLGRPARWNEAATAQGEP